MFHFLKSFVLIAACIYAGFTIGLPFGICPALGGSIFGLALGCALFR